jgi:defect-in-organelle-trafficking protein DotC
MSLIRTILIAGVLITIPGTMAAFAATDVTKDTSLFGVGVDSDRVKENDTIPIPPVIETLKEIPGPKEIKKETALPIDIRKEALKEAALSYGARGGLASRTYEIRQQLKKRASYLDNIYNFRQLLIAAPSGLQMEPPIISESLDALLIENDGQTAAVSDAVYNINNNVKIVSAARNWRIYLEREWGTVEEPPEILRPVNAEERALWRELVEKGWAEGITQADEIFEQDLASLNADFNGMIRYRKLLAQNMVSPPFAQQLDRGVTGSKDGDVMRIGDRAVSITQKPKLISGSDSWRPASR